MDRNFMLYSLYNFVNNLTNYDLINYFKIHNNFYSPQANLNILDKSLKHVALGAIYQQSPPGFEIDKKTAFAVTNSNMANADTGATGSYIAIRDIECLHDVLPCSQASQIHVQVAYGQIMTSSYIGELRVPDGDIIKAYIFPGISASLLSISQFVDVGYTVIYSRDKVAFKKG